jgi:hypothetical protein
MNQCYHPTLVLSCNQLKKLTKFTGEQLVDAITMFCCWNCLPLGSEKIKQKVCERIKTAFTTDSIGLLDGEQEHEIIKKLGE